MPLKCLQDGKELYSFDIKSKEDWEDLRKANAKLKNLQMACCGAAVALRTSKLGTRHFAHSAVGACATAPESSEHLLAKIAIVEAIRNTDWTPFPEVAGCTPAGEEWRADVLALKGTSKVAFEIQWSRQTADETQRRQKCYDEAGVRSLWLFRQKDFPTEKETPAFCLTFDSKTQSFLVHLPSACYCPTWSKKWLESDSCWEQSIPLPVFIHGALSGRLRFAPALSLTMPVEISKADIPCWRCKKVTGAIMRLNFAASRALPGCNDFETTIYELSQSLPNGDAVVMSMLPANLLRSYGIGAVKPRYSKTCGGKYLSNGCLHCDALQGQFFDHDYIDDSVKAFEINVEFKSEWGPLLEEAQSSIYRWWFNEAQCS